MPTLEQIIETKRERLNKIIVMELVLSRHGLLYPVDLNLKEQVYYLRRGIYHYREDMKHYGEKYGRQRGERC